MKETTGYKMYLLCQKKRSLYTRLYNDLSKATKYGIRTLSKKTIILTILYAIWDAKIFAKLDIAKGFWQLL